MITRYYMIAQHRLSVRFADGLDADALIPSFSPFVCEAGGSVLLEMDVCEGTAPDFSQMDEIGQFDCGGANHGVYQGEDGGYAFEISLPSCDGGALSCCLTTNAGFSSCRAVLMSAAPRQQQFGLNNALMMAFAFAAAEQDTLLVHASVIRNDGYGYLFTAPSGTGKSTHTHLWYKYIPGSDLMNDDNPVVRIVDGETIIFGSPWSGKTPCYRNKSYQLGGVVMLSQAPYNKIRRLSGIYAYVALVPSISGKRWDQRIADGLHDTENALAMNIPIWHLECLPDEAAAQLCHQTIVR